MPHTDSTDGAWWHVDPVPVASAPTWKFEGSATQHPEHLANLYADIKSYHGLYFRHCVQEQMLSMIHDGLERPVARLVEELVVENGRFYPSLFMVALLRDLDILNLREGVYACAAIEFLQLARLIHDDVIDEHDRRWGRQTLRSLVGNDQAILAAATLRALAAVCAEQIDESSEASPEGRAYKSSTVVVDEYSRVIANGMLSELRFNNSEQLTRSRYGEIAWRKHCSDVVCARLVAQFAIMSPRDAVLLVRSARLSGIAAGIVNDVTEAHGKRGGGDSPRKPSGEWRGERTEIQLGRPTIFHQYLTSDVWHTYRSDPEREISLPILPEIPSEQIYGRLLGIGAVDYAYSENMRLRREALATLPVGFDYTGSVLARGSKMHLPRRRESERAP